MTDILFITPNFRNRAAIDSIGTMLLATILRQNGLRAEILPLYDFGNPKDFGQYLDNAQRMILEYAAMLRDQGYSASRILEGLEDIRDRITLFACIDTLEYLYKGGRISQTAYKLGTLANIKPIISIEDGKVTIPAKAMGMRKGMDFLCKKVLEKAPDENFPLYVMYTNNRSVAETLAQRLDNAGLPVSDDRIIQVGAGIGSHIGPDACGFVYVKA